MFQELIQNLSEMYRLNPKMLLFLALGIALLFVLILMLFQTLFGKTPDKSTTYDKPAPSQNHSHSPIDAQKVDTYIEKLENVSQDGRTILDYLDLEIKHKNQLVKEKSELVSELDKQKNNIEERLKMLEENPNELLEKIERENRRKIKELKEQASNQSISSGFLGFFVGLLIFVLVLGILAYFGILGNIQAWVARILK